MTSCLYDCPVDREEICPNQKLCHIWSDKAGDYYFHFVHIQQLEKHAEELVSIISIATEYKDTVQVDLPLGGIYFQKSLDGFHCNLGNPSDFFDFEKIKKERLFLVLFIDKFSITKYQNGKEVLTKEFKMSRDNSDSLQIVIH